MSTDEKGTPTPQKTLNLATQQASLPKLALIGTFGSLTDPGALIRDGRGRIHRVTLNDKISDGIVAAIGDDSVVLAQRGRTPRDMTTGAAPLLTGGGGSGKATP